MLLYLPILIFLLFAYALSKILQLLFSFLCIAAFVVASLLLLHSFHKYFNAGKGEESEEGGAHHHHHHHLKGADNTTVIQKRTMKKQQKKKRVTFSDPISCFELAEAIHGRFSRRILATSVSILVAGFFCIISVK
jgi:hypothetical protein